MPRLVFIVDGIHGPLSLGLSIYRRKKFIIVYRWNWSNLLCQLWKMLELIGWWMDVWLVGWLVGCLVCWPSYLGRCTLYVYSVYWFFVVSRKCKYSMKLPVNPLTFCHYRRTNIHNDGGGGISHCIPFRFRVYVYSSMYGWMDGWIKCENVVVQKVISVPITHQSLKCSLFLFFILEFYQLFILLFKFEWWLAVSPWWWWWLLTNYFHILCIALV